MITMVHDKLKVLQALCRKYQVKKLELFGSALTGERFDEQDSDIDFLVEFLPLPQGQNAETYFGLLESLETLFQRRVDLVMRSAIQNRYFRMAVDNQCEVIYAN